MNSRCRGFSLVEMVVGVFLLGVLVMLAVPGLRSSRPTEQALAQELVAHLRAARQRALTRHARCAVMLPSDPGNSISQLEGSVFARVVKCRAWASEYPRVRVQTTSDSSVNTETQEWLGSMATLPGVIFDSDGRPSGNRTFAVTGKEDWMVVVREEGRIESYRSRTRVAAKVGEPLPPLRPEARSNRAPRLKTLGHSPRVDPSMLEGNVQAIVPNGGTLTLKVEAEDDDGDQLFVHWSIPERWSPDPDPEHANAGAFSCPDEQPMFYDPDRKVWTAECAFDPEGTNQGRRYKLLCTIRDEHGARADVTSQSSLMVANGLRGTFAFRGNSAQDPDGPIGLWTSTPEGHRVRQVLERAGQYAALSPNGEKIAFGNVGDGVFICNADGSDADQLFGPSYCNAAFSPSGAWVAVFRLDSDNRFRKLHVCRVNRDSTDSRSFTLPDNCIPVAVWDSDNATVYIQYKTEAVDFYGFNGFGGGMTPAQQRTYVRAIRVLGVEENLGKYADLEWPEQVGKVLFPSPSRRCVRGSDPAGTLYEFRLPGEFPNADPTTPDPRVVRQWSGGGDSNFVSPSVGSPYERQTVMMEGWLDASGRITTDTEYHRNRGYAVWKSGQDTQRRLLLDGVIPRACIPNWSK